jgi:hypothetical protein
LRHAAAASRRCSKRSTAASIREASASVRRACDAPERDFLGFDFFGESIALSFRLAGWLLCGVQFLTRNHYHYTIRAN